MDLGGGSSWVVDGWGRAVGGWQGLMGAHGATGSWRGLVWAGGAGEGPGRGCWGLLGDTESEAWPTAEPLRAGAV